MKKSLLMNLHRFYAHFVGHFYGLDVHHFGLRDIIYKNNVIQQNGNFIIIVPRIYYTIEN